MTKMEGHLVTFSAATDLEETNPNYSEADVDFPSGVCDYNEVVIGRDGRRHLVYPDGMDGYEARKAQWSRERASVQHTPNERVDAILKNIKGYRGLTSLELLCLREKIAERTLRNAKAKEVREAKTKAAALSLLEEFHREGYSHRKITALHLDCMKEIREIRKKAALRARRRQRTR